MGLAAPSTYGTVQDTSGVWRVHYDTRAACKTRRGKEFRVRQCALQNVSVATRFRRIRKRAGLKYPRGDCRSSVRPEKAGAGGARLNSTLTIYLHINWATRSSQKWFYHFHQDANFLATIPHALGNRCARASAVWNKFWPPQVLTHELRYEGTSAAVWSGSCTLESATTSSCTWKIIESTCSEVPRYVLRFLWLLLDKVPVDVRRNNEVWTCTSFQTVQMRFMEKISLEYLTKRKDSHSRADAMSIWHLPFARIMMLISFHLFSQKLMERVYCRRYSHIYYTSQL